uniref:ATP synthase F0 subunit 6 n=1 Tax=Tetrapedia diversipes TaxID=889126 RepID=UPI001EFA033B|nr:ATP synthase F0 subunit 6 [Tetrapedia diversipes]UKG21057.1 ATP synthase F0 subunit 6 [Tetrapedia diversipes]
MKMTLMNLFENFDPSTKIGSLNWIMVMIPMFLIPSYFWIIPSRMNMIFNKFINLIYSEFKTISTNKYQPNILMFLSLMIFIMLLNLIGLMPYIFTLTSHMSFNLPLSLTIWFSVNYYSWMNYPIKTLSHLVPLNTPSMLMNFMVIIELVSNIIRPLTLAIRLMANLMAGHLLLTLLGTFISNSSLIIMMFMLIIQNLLFILEISMSFIQSYVFSILSILYFSEAKN